MSTSPLAAASSSSSAAVAALPTLNTLDEPIRDTIMRDIKAIGEKMRYVMLPASRHDKMRGLRDWDLWGPFLLCIILSVVLSVQAGSNAAGDSQSGYVFAMVFVLVWVGSGVVTFNASLLQGKVSFFQCVCVLGYCLAPLVLSAIACGFLNAVKLRYAKVGVVLLGFLWSTFASVGFMAELLPEDRKALGIYPVGLFYFAIAWIVLVA